ncbi:hypothetical protein CEUSTIGMA_g1092.t1 [Chlamydomonas eustigma]|uniref:Uncharacterized protein n=1 Tax=Chlamydomonas eustigma TaxID=1157962 RepID=A0A250WS63_9CHLO|nr:hypothetical protein CEUSTIGMA_g1092.t1 [Chlamydomonas eustigma]|eukprot:GAX73641.1 hypothetical protein CEUSTIGMA_g1092.t1 [Chlamydomonas eustigma]
MHDASLGHALSKQQQHHKNSSCPAAPLPPRSSSSNGMNAPLLRSSSALIKQFEGMMVSPADPLISPSRFSSHPKAQRRIMSSDLNFRHPQPDFDSAVRSQGTVALQGETMPQQFPPAGGAPPFRLRSTLVEGSAAAMLSTASSDHYSDVPKQDKQGGDVLMMIQHAAAVDDDGRHEHGTNEEPAHQFLPPACHRNSNIVTARQHSASESSFLMATSPACSWNP